MKNYYDILGVARDAPDAEIKKAYRKLARNLHPDVNKGKDAEDKFKSVGEAYEVLKDPEKRRLYDQYGEQWQQAAEAEKQGFKYQQNGGGFASQGGSQYTYSSMDQEDLNDILRDLFGRASTGGSHSSGNYSHGFGDSFSGRFTQAREPEREKEREEHELPVSLYELYNGGERYISFQSYEQLGGRVQPVTKKLKVKIPKGMTDGSIFRLGGKNGMPELFIRLKLENDSVFSVDGYDLKTTVPISYIEAALGAKVPVRTLDGTVQLTVPKGSQNGRQLRLKGKGLKKRGTSSGDLLVRLEVRMPDHLSGREEKLLQELAEISSFDPRGSTSQRATAEV